VSSDSPVDISIVVPTYNGAHLLKQCVDSLLQQDVPSGSFEIVIVDDCSTDDTPAVVQGMKVGAGPHRLQYIRLSENGGPGHARNEGIRLALGRLIGLVDHDVYVAADWLRHALPYFAEPGIGGIEGRTDLPEGSRPTPFTHQTENTDQLVYRTCNIFYRREVFEKVGEFDERFYDRKRRVHFREDADFAFRVLDAGWEIRFAPEVRAFHPPLAPDWHRPLRLAERHMFDALLKRKHPIHYARNVDVHRVLGFRTSRLRKKIYTAFLLAAVGTLVGAVFGSLVAIAGCGALLGVSYAAVVALHVRGRAFSVSEIPLILLIALVVPFVYARAVARGFVRYKAIAFT